MLRYFSYNYHCYQSKFVCTLYYYYSISSYIQSVHISLSFPILTVRIYGTSYFAVADKWALPHLFCINRDAHRGLYYYLYGTVQEFVIYICDDGITIHVKPGEIVWTLQIIAIIYLLPNKEQVKSWIKMWLGVVKGYMTDWKIIACLFFSKVQESLFSLINYLWLLFLPFVRRAQERPGLVLLQWI